MRRHMIFLHDMQSTKKILSICHHMCSFYNMHNLLNLLPDTPTNSITNSPFHWFQNIIFMNSSTSFLHNLGGFVLRRIFCNFLVLMILMHAPRRTGPMFDMLNDMATTQCMYMNSTVFQHCPNSTELFLCKKQEKIQAFTFHHIVPGSLIGK